LEALSGNPKPKEKLSKDKKFPSLEKAENTFEILFNS